MKNQSMSVRAVTVLLSSALSVLIGSKGTATAFSIYPSQSMTCRNILTTPKKVRTFGQTTNNAASNEDDDCFDPLLSPHSYPKGTPSPNEKKTISKDDDNINDDEDWTPMKMNSVKDDFTGATENDYTTRPSTWTSSWSNSNDDGNDSNTIDSVVASSFQAKKENDDDNEVLDSNFDYFDPRISPHSFPNGIPDDSTTTTTTTTTSKKGGEKIGIVLVDHGSRRESSNEALQTLASIYQQNYFANDNDNDNGDTDMMVVVKAAHMEIAPPSILDVVQDLVENHKVQTIICHPYFLSPGRHVTEDIPQLVQEAQEWAGDSVQITTTDPVGADPQIMAQLIHQVLTPTLQTHGLLLPNSSNNENDASFMEKQKQPLGGIFGDIQRMLEEIEP